MIILSKFQDSAPIRHAFFTRKGGVSKGVYSGLNCGLGSRDAPENVSRNRSLAVEKLGVPAGALLTLRQEHTERVVTVKDGWTEQDLPVADAMVTAIPGLVLGILTADCAPVLLVAPEQRVIGAAHAGWRGAIGGVLEATLEAMEHLGARRSEIHAAIGPCIAQPSYEVDGDFCEVFLRKRADNRAFFVPSDQSGHFLFDLAGYVAVRLVSAGVETVVQAGCDTYPDEERFFSYRRTTKRAENDYGRQLSALVLCE